MDHSTVRFELPTTEEGYVFDLDSLVAEFEMLTDKRKDQGKRYTLALVLLLLVLAKLLCMAGQEEPATATPGDCRPLRPTGLPTRFQPTPQRFPLRPQRG